MLRLMLAYSGEEYFHKKGVQSGATGTLAVKHFDQPFDQPKTGYQASTNRCS